MRNEGKPEAVRVLLAVADAGYAKTLENFLASRGYTLDRCHDAPGVLRLGSRRDYHVVVLDLALGQEHDVDLVSFMRHHAPGCRLILLFDMSDFDRALEGIRKGAYFYLPKASLPGDVALVVDKALKELASRAAIDRYEQTLFEELVGGSRAMQRVVELISKVAPTDSTVLLLGESGTGKEVLANAVHRLSRRKEQPFVAINCAALPEALLESELFGHVKGAFTGAERDKSGLFEEADGGTVFLDEIGDMALVTQAKLLRVLQSGEIRRVGSATSQRVDVRIIAATNRDLTAAVSKNQFREDLYFRLNVITIRIPPLRERMDALPVLVEHFLGQFNARYGKQVRGLDDHAAGLLQHYDYPGNVRELESIIAHAVIMAEGERIRARDLPDQVQAGSVQRLSLPFNAADTVRTLSEVEADHIRQALRRFDGNQTVAAKKLGISRSTLWRKMREYGIEA